MDYKTNMSGPEQLGQKLTKMADAAFSCEERRNVETTWAEIAEFILPAQNNKFHGSKSRGSRNDRRVFDTTGILACRDLAASMHSTITNPATRWSKLRFKQTSLNNLPAANAWTSNATIEIHNALADSNFDNQIGRAYQSHAGFGTMVMLHDEIREEGKYAGLNFAAWHLGEIAYAENSKGIVDCIYHKFSFTLRQAYEEFGDEIGEDLVKKLETAPLDEVEFIHCIYPRNKKEVKLNEFGDADALHRPFASDYVLTKGSKVVRRDGYYEFPVYVSRWLTLPGEVYGYGPGQMCLPDVLTLNVIERQMLKGLAKAIDPVIFQEQNNVLTGDMRPGKLVSVRNLAGIKEGVTQSRFDIGFLEAKELRDAIKSGFYIDKLMLPPRTETGEMTAYEIQQRLEQMQVVLGPPLSRLNTEFLTPLIMRTLKMLMRAGIIPPVPKEVADMSTDKDAAGNRVVDLDIAFVNSLARSQQMSELRNITAWVQEVGGMAQAIDPQAIDYIDMDQIAEKTARIRDIPEELVRTDEEVDGMRKQRQEAQAAQAALQMGESASNIAKNVGSLQGGKVK